MEDELCEGNIKSAHQHSILKTGVCSVLYLRTNEATAQIRSQYR